MNGQPDHNQSGDGNGSPTESRFGNRSTVGGNAGTLQSTGAPTTREPIQERINGSVANGDIPPGSENIGVGSATDRSGDSGTAAGFEWTRGIDRGKRYSGRGRKPGGSTTRTTQAKPFRADIPTGVKPENVSVQDLFNEQSAKGKDSNTADLLADFIQSVFKAPSSMGYGSHWQLPREDARDISVKLLKCIKTLPNSKLTQKIINQWSPWVALILTLFAILQPRIELTQELKRVGKLGYTIKSVKRNTDAVAGQTSRDGTNDARTDPTGSFQGFRGQHSTYNPTPDSGLFD